MEARPRSSFEAIEAEFLLELLISLLADPSALDRGRELSEWGLGREVRDIVFLLPAWPDRAAIGCTLSLSAGPIRPAM